MSNLHNASHKGNKGDGRSNNDNQLTSYPMHVHRSLNAFSFASPIAPRLRTYMKYADLFTAQSGINQDYRFRPNSLFDPDITFAGHQPLGFDQLSALYGKYRVYSCSYKITFQMATTAYTPTTFVVVASNSTASLGGPVSTAIEHSGSNYKLNNFGGQCIILRGRVDNWILNGRTRQQYADDDTTAALVSTNPAENLTLHVVMGCTDQASTLNVALAVELDYDAEFFDPNQLTQS